MILDNGRPITFEFATDIDAFCKAMAELHWLRGSVRGGALRAWSMHGADVEMYWLPNDSDVRVD